VTSPTEGGSGGHPPGIHTYHHHLQKPERSCFHSYNKVGATKHDFTMISKSVNNVLYFAGEHTCHEYRGSVHGAYLSGIRVAKEVWDNDDDD